MTANRSIAPACDTKHVKNLVLPLRFAVDREIVLELEQDDAGGATTGTTLWLGAQVCMKCPYLKATSKSEFSNRQVLTAYLLHTLPTSSAERRTSIELGSGIGEEPPTFSQVPFL